VGSPYIIEPSALLVMNGPSLEKFGARVKKGGLIVINTSLVAVACERTDVTVVYVDAGGLAVKAGAARAANIVMLGVYVGYSGIVSHDLAAKMIEKEFAEKAKFIPANLAAFEAGYSAGVESRKGGA
jgi:2-oxoglutarate ferredoxin oxidoreductase subunit gamma